MAALLRDTAAQVARGTNTFAPEEMVALLAEIERPPDRRSQIQLEARIAYSRLLAGQTVEAAAIYGRLLAEVDAQPELFGPAAVAELTSQAAIAHLRLGEQQNCLGRHTGQSCLLPITGEGVHVDQAGAREAMRLYLRLLAERPDDLTSRWLLNLAAMAVGEWPAGVPAALRIPPEAFASEADPPRFVDVAPAVGLDTVTLAGGAVTDDLDGDGLLDLMVSAWGWKDPLRFFKNTGDGRFVEKSAEAGLEGLTGGLNLNSADYDNDGDLDVLVLRGAWQGEAGRFPNSLLRNRGDGRFEDVTEAAGLLDFHPTQTAAWGDYDHDGWLDLYVGNESTPGHPHPCRLFRNRGDGTFEDTTKAQGVEVVGYVKAVAWGDVNNDGFPDLYVSRLDGPNRLFQNHGGRGFEDVTAKAGVAEPLASFPAWFFDFDHDGWLDLFVSGFATSYAGADISNVAADFLGLPTAGERPRLYRNRGDGTFEDVTRERGLWRVLYAMGSNFGDLNADGWLDLYLGTGAPDYRALMPNRAFLNLEGRRFADVTTAGGLGHLQKGHAVAFADLDNDGDEDLFHVVGGAYSGDVYPNALFENPTQPRNWVTLVLRGVKANRSAIGARLKLTVEGPGGRRELHRVVGTGGSFGASSLQQEIGLGDATHIVSLEILWPGSLTRQSFESVPMGRVVEVVEGEGELVELKRKTFRLGGS